MASPAQDAWTMPTGILFMACDRNRKAVICPRMTTAVGNGLVKPFADLSATCDVASANTPNKRNNQLTTKLQSNF